jgi:TPR repeat protein
MVKLGRDLLKHGDVESARFLLKRAAIAGDAGAALELGLSFDETVLAQSGVLGSGSDVGQAREWYEKAIKLGSTEASRHLARLASMPK